MAAKQTATRSAYHHGNLREELVSQGLAILESEGLAALSMREIARRIGVAQTAPLHHFEGKNALLAAIAAVGFRMLFETRMQALRDQREPADRLMAVLLAYVEFARAHPQLFHLMHGPDIPDKSVYPELNGAAIRSYSVLETAVSDYLMATDGTLDRRREATLAAWTACHGLAHIMTSPQNTPTHLLRRDPAGVSRAIFEIFLRGLGEPKH